MIRFRLQKIFNDTTLHFLKRLKGLFSESSNILLKHNNLVENCQLEQDLLLLHELSTQLRSCILFGVTMVTKEQMFLSKCSPQKCACIFEVVDVPCLQHHTKAERVSNIASTWLMQTGDSWVIKFKFRDFFLSGKQQFLQHIVCLIQTSVTNKLFVKLLFKKMTTYLLCNYQAILKQEVKKRFGQDSSWVYFEATFDFCHRTKLYVSICLSTFNVMQLCSIKT